MTMQICKCNGEIHTYVHTQTHTHTHTYTYVCVFVVILFIAFRLLEVVHMLRQHCCHFQNFIVIILSKLYSYMKWALMCHFSNGFSFQTGRKKVMSMAKLIQDCGISTDDTHWRYHDLALSHQCYSTHCQHRATHMCIWKHKCRDMCNISIDFEFGWKIVCALGPGHQWTRHTCIMSGFVKMWGWCYMVLTMVTFRPAAKLSINPPSCNDTYHRQWHG